jgi:hypothetical protein
MASGCLGVGSLKASASGHVSVVRVGKAGVFAGGQKTLILDATQKRQRRSACTLHIQIYFITWVACAREMMAPNVFGCG